MDPLVKKTVLNPVLYMLVLSAWFTGIRGGGGEACLDPTCRVCAWNETSNAYRRTRLPCTDVAGFLVEHQNHIALPATISGRCKPWIDQVNCVEDNAALRMSRSTFSLRFNKIEV